VQCSGILFRFSLCQRNLYLAGPNLLQVLHDVDMICPQSIALASIESSTDKSIFVTLLLYFILNLFCKMNVHVVNKY